jgi:hypothetical protein
MEYAGIYVNGVYAKSLNNSTVHSDSKLVKQIIDIQLRTIESNPGPQAYK